MHREPDRTLLASGSSIAHRASGLTIDARDVGDVTVLLLTGEILLDDGDFVFREQIHDLIADDRTKVVVDFGGVTHIDSSGAGMLVAKLQTVRKTGGDIRLVNLAPRHQRLLATMRVLTIFQIFEDEASAVRSFANRASP